MSTPETSSTAARKARNHAARMSHTGRVQPCNRPGAICDIDSRRDDPGPATGDLTFAGIAGSMDDHADKEEGEVFGL